MKRYAVVLGGGVTGLTAAYKLSRFFDVVVLEKNKTIGGLLRSVDRGNYFIEAYYHHVFVRDRCFSEFVNEFGLGDRMVWDYPPTAFEYRKGFYELSSPQDILFFKPLSFTDKISLMKLMLKIKMIKSPETLDDVGVKDWLLKNANKRIYERFFGPMLTSKYGKNIDNISASWFIERMRIRGNRGFKGERLGYMTGGFQMFLGALKVGIERNGGVIETGVRKIKITQRGDRIGKIKYKNKIIKPEVVLSTIPLESITRMVKFPNNYKRALLSIKGQGAICVILGLKKPLSRLYWTNIISKDVCFGALIEHNNFSYKLKYPENIIYLASYPDYDSVVWKMGKGEIFNLYFNDLRKLYPKIDKSDVKWWDVIMDRYAGILYEKGIRRKIVGCSTPIKNLYLGGVFNSYPERGINTSVEMGIELAGCCKNV